MVLAFIFIYASVCSAVVKVLRTERGAVGSSAVILTRGGNLRRRLNIVELFYRGDGPQNIIFIWMPESSAILVSLPHEH